MRFDLKANYVFNSDISVIKKEIENFISNYNKSLIEKDKTANIKNINIIKNILSLNIISEGSFRPHNALLQMKNFMSKEFGKKHRLGIRDIKIEGYSIEVELEKNPLKNFSIPFAYVYFK